MDLVRMAYGNIQSETELKSFTRLVNSVSCEKVGAYRASATMQQAQFALAPWKKYGYFLEGKKMLEDHIQKYPNDLEARYVRFLIQSHCPIFLGYRSERGEDTEFIRKNIKEYDLPLAYKQQIENNIEVLLKK